MRESQMIASHIVHALYHQFDNRVNTKQMFCQQKYGSWCLDILITLQNSSNQNHSAFNINQIKQCSQILPACAPRKKQVNTLYRYKSLQNAISITQQNKNLLYKHIKTKRAESEYTKQKSIKLQDNKKIMINKNQKLKQILKLDCKKLEKQKVHTQKIIKNTARSRFINKQDASKQNKHSSKVIMLEYNICNQKKVKTKKNQNLTPIKFIISSKQKHLPLKIRKSEPILSIDRVNTENKKCENQRGYLKDNRILNVRLQNKIKNENKKQLKLKDVVKVYNEEQLGELITSIMTNRRRAKIKTVH